MIKLLEESGKNNKGETIDKSIYLIRLDTNNLAISRGKTVINYFGDVRTALKRSLNYVVKGSTQEFTLEAILDTIRIMDKKIDSLPRDTLKKEGE